MPRFAILAHQVGPGFDRKPDGIHDTSLHWDWMFEPDTDAEGLWTWATAPVQSETGTVKSVRLADHRMIYLTYEGSLSEDRGTVSQLACGRYQWIEKTERYHRMKLFYDQFISSWPVGDEIEMRTDYSSLGPSDPGSTWTFRIGIGGSGSSKVDAIS